MKAYDIALILAAAFALATFSARDVHPAPLPGQFNPALQTAMTSPQ